MASTKRDRRLAELAADHWLRSLGCVVTVRAVRTQFQRQDLFGGDCIGKDKTGRLYVVQATAGQDSAVTARRRKLEPIPWDPSDFVCVAQLRKVQDPANRRRWLRFFRICEFAQVGPSGARKWAVWDEAPKIPPDWLKSTKKSPD